MTTNEARTAARTADSSPAAGLGDRVVEHFRTMTATLRGMLEAIGELERRGAFRSGAYTSTASWVMANLSVGYPTARGYVEVGSALVELPELADAFGAGEVSFDQMRSLARVATPVNDAELARRARRWSASQTEDFVRGEETRRADEARRRREEALVALRAHEAQRRGEGSATPGGSDQAAPKSGPWPAPTASSPRCPAIPAAPASTRPASLRLHTRRDGGTLEGWFPTEEFAAIESTLLAMARAAAPDALSGRQVPLPERMAQALVERVASATDGERAAPTLVVHADVSLLDGSGDGTDVAVAPGAGPLGADVLRRLACEAKVRLAADQNGLTLDLGRSTRLPGASLAREVLRRDEGCRFPGCTARRFLQIHHVVPWADGGATDLGNLAAHCVLDHRRIHHGGWTVTGHANGELEYRGPSGECLVSTPAPGWTASRQRRRSNRQRT